jgi:hypothetical protein
MDIMDIFFNDVQQIDLCGYLLYKIFLMPLSLQKIFRLPLLVFAVEGSEGGAGILFQYH